MTWKHRKPSVENTRPTFFHRTTARAARQILRDGFRDAESGYMTGDTHRGVWLSDRPLDANEGAFGDALLEVEIAEAVIAPYEWVEEGRAFREFLVPAALVNEHGVVQRVNEAESDHVSFEPEPEAPFDENDTNDRRGYNGICPVCRQLPVDYWTSDPPAAVADSALRTMDWVTRMGIENANVEIMGSTIWAICPTHRVRWMTCGAPGSDAPLLEDSEIADFATVTPAYPPHIILEREENERRFQELLARAEAPGPPVIIIEDEEDGDEWTR